MQLLIAKVLLLISMEKKLSMLDKSCIMWQESSKNNMRDCEVRSNG